MICKRTKRCESCVNAFLYLFNNFFLPKINCWNVTCSNGLRTLTNIFTLINNNEKNGNGDGNHYFVKRSPWISVIMNKNSYENQRLNKQQYPFMYCLFTPRNRFISPLILWKCTPLEPSRYLFHLKILQGEPCKPDFSKMSINLFSFQTNFHTEKEDHSQHHRLNTNMCGWNTNCFTQFWR